MKNLIPIAFLVALTILGFGPAGARASQAYGTINNFDVVNDTSNVCHGFEIELDDLHSSDVSYTYDYNHYGIPRFTEEHSLDGLGVWHTNLLVDYAAVWTNSGWSAYTAAPTNAIPPTMGHQFTNPNLNFGGEHFGIGFTRNPSKVLYFWLADSGAHTLARSGQVYVSTPTFTYSPPVVVGQQQVQPAAVQAVIPAPILPQSYVCPNPEFSDAVWCKVISTTTQTNSAVSINDLMTPDTNNPAGRDWRNGQTNVEVETEWQLLQIDYLSASYNPTNGLGGNNAQLPGANRSLTNSDDVVTYRYEYYAYAGPYADWDTHEAMCQMPGADGVHGTGTYVDGNGITNSLTNVVVVGKFLGAQMSAMAATPPVGLIDHVPDGVNGVEYLPRTVIIAGNTNFTVSYTGTLPAGMAFDISKAVLYGTPYATGVFIFTVTATASNNPPVRKTYPFLISSGAAVPPHSAVDTGVSMPNAGTTHGDGIYTNGTTATVSVTPNAGYGFANWTENGTVVSTARTYTFTNIVNHSLVANFVPVLMSKSQARTLTISWLTNFPGYTLQQSSSLRSSNWVSATEGFSLVGSNYQAAINLTNASRFFRIYHP
ncbi:MAG TPA: putative Ig domain-containing protein [Verrucomicrobiae bacterium]